MRRPWSSGPTRTRGLRIVRIISSSPDTARSHLMLRRLHALDVLAEAERRRLELADQVYLCATLRNLVFHPQCPVNAVHDQPARAFGFKIGRGAHRRRED